MPGEIATAYVRLRPISDSFRSEAQSQIRASLAQMNRTAAVDSTRALRGQVDIAKRSNAELAVLAREQARQNVKSASEQLRELKAIGGGYRKLATDARLSAEERSSAARLASEAETKSALIVGRHIDETREKTHSLSESVKGLAATFGTTIGAVAGLNFLKSVVNDAATAQKALEAVDAAFGTSGAAIKNWAKGAAVDLGVSSQTALTTAARFGIAYRQIGVGAGLASQMTLGFEKLAGSIATIRGIRPDLVFQNLSSAATGNVRSLRTLGITIDQSQLKWAALKLGIVDTVKNGLTPAQKAEAVYALATSRLTQYQQEARKHAGDLATQQAKLSAEWSNAKGILGDALLPAMTRLITHLATWLGKMEKSGRLQRDVNRAVRDGTTAFNDIKGAITPIIGLLGRLSAGAGGAKNAIKQLIAAFAILRGRKLLADLGLIKTGVKGVGSEAEAATGFVGKLRGALLGLAGKVFVVTLLLDLLPKNPTAAAAAKASGWNWVNKLPGGSAIYGLSGAIDKFLGFHDYENSIKKATQEGLITPTPAKLLYQDVLPVLQRGLLTLKALKSLRDRINAADPTGDTYNGLLLVLKRQLYAAGAAGRATNKIGEVVGQRWTALANSYLSNRAINAIKADAARQIAELQRKYNIGKAAADSIFNAEIATRVKTAQRELAAAIVSGGQLVATAQRSLRAYLLRGYAANVQALKSEQAALESVGKRAIANVRTLGSTLITDIGKFQSALAAKKPTSLAGVGPFGPAVQQLLDYIHGGQPSAKLAQEITGVRSQLAGKVPKGAGTGQQTAAQKLAEAKRLVNAHINLLVEQAQKGQLSVKQLSERLNHYLEKSGFTYQKVAKLLGKAAADKFRADAKNIGAQLLQIDKLPPKLKKKLLAQASGGLTNPVVSIAAELAKIQSADKARQARYNTGLQSEIAGLRRAQKRDREIVAKAQQHLRDVNAADQLLSLRHSHTELVKHTALLKAIANTTARAAKSQKAIASVVVNPNAFPSSTSKNPGATSKNAHTAAAAGVSG